LALPLGTVNLEVTNLCWRSRTQNHGALRNRFNLGLKVDSMIVQELDTLFGRESK